MSDIPSFTIDEERPVRTVDRLRLSANDSVEFINTDTAAALLDSFDAASLRVSAAFEDELETERTQRYGGPYAWISRNLAQSIAGVHDSYRGKYGLFSVEEEWFEEEHDWLESPIDCSAIQLTGDLAADIVIDQLHQLYRRDTFAESNMVSDIPVACKPERFKHLGCKDVEEYFSQAFAMNKVSVDAIGDKRFWHKTHGGHTYLNCEKVIYNGIHVPPGCVFRKDEGGYTMLRMTGFVFDKQSAEHVFGSAMLDGYSLQSGETRMTQVFSAFESARKCY